MSRGDRARSCRAEYAYYDAIPSSDPDVIEPLDVLVTVAMNSFVNTAVKVRLVHQGMAANCEPLLGTIPEHADLVDLEHWRTPLRELLHAAVQAPRVLIPVATKVVHRKRRLLIPMLDSVVLRHYLSAPEFKAPLAGTENKARAADVAMEALRLFRDDLLARRNEIDALRKRLAREGFALTPVRILEVLVSTQMEPPGATARPLVRERSRRREARPDRTSGESRRVGSGSRRCGRARPA
ncbi:MAG: DUF6308 family protein [Thermoleophilaceae bacterium]